MNMGKAKIESFKKKILKFFKEHGRHHLPWRQTQDPYKILVSEVMLQQTQVDRVIPKYKAFLKAFPTVKRLSEAKLSQVLLHWSGLGYNRRARMLHEAAKKVVKENGGNFSTRIEALKELPGVGPYTAAAVVTFAYNQPVVMIETNIRSVFIHEFFKDRKEVNDKEIIKLIALSLPKRKSREWYAALMDYGAHLKKENPNPSRKSKHHVKQSMFKGSLRETRGKILKELLKKPQTLGLLIKEIQKPKIRVEKALEGLHKDGLIRKEKQRWCIT